MKMFGRSWNLFFVSNNQTKSEISRCSEAKWFCNPIKVTGILLVSLLGFFVLFSVMKGWPSYSLLTVESKPWKEDVDLEDIMRRNKIIGEYCPEPTENATHDKLLGGLLPAGLDEKSCVSRYQSALYRKQQKHQPSSYLISRLRKYEALHRQCGPQTNSYKKALKYLKSGGQYTSNSTDCKYIIWTPVHGLGNRILSLTSAFLYALLTNRVLLADPVSKISNLFCEPFPESSWILPSNFPLIGKLKHFYTTSPESYGNMLRNNTIHTHSPPYVYLHLVHDYDDYDKQFFCEEAQVVLQNVPWLIVKSNIYFIPSLFTIQSFQQEFNNLFPDLGTVFHHLGRYLLHPTNKVWGLITWYYKINLANADERIGIQVRVLDSDPDPGRFKRVLDQILGCVVIKEKLLPQVNETKSVLIPPSQKLKTKAVLITSLTSEYSEAIKEMYWKRSNVTGEVIKVYQPSHEEREKYLNQMQDIKAWAEMYLLSLTDKLVTSGGSTFGYIAYCLGGLKPWILYQPQNHKVPEPPCQRAVSMEPCMHAPPYYDCIRKERTDISKPIPHIQHCEDSNWGLKFIDRDMDL